jgi:hypothetical protein
MKKYNTTYTANEMAETIHRTAMELAFKAGYHEEMEHYYGCISPNAYKEYSKAEYHKNKAEHFCKMYCFTANLAWEAGASIKDRKRRLAKLMGAIAARKEYSKEA